MPLTPLTPNPLPASPSARPGSSLAATVARGLPALVFAPPLPVSHVSTIIISRTPSQVFSKPEHMQRTLYLLTRLGNPFRARYNPIPITYRADVTLDNPLPAMEPTVKEVNPLSFNLLRT